MMNVVKKGVYLFGVLLTLGACSSDDSTGGTQPQTFEIEIEATDATHSIDDFSGFTYEVYNQNTAKVIQGKLDTQGKAKVELEVGNYNFKVEQEAVGFGSKGNVSLNKAQVVEIPVELSKQTLEGLVISELFTAGEGAEDEYGEYVELADQYVVIANNSKQVKYLDGISYAITNHWNKFPYNDIIAAALQENAVYADVVYTFPGTGKDYPIQPGQEIVLARSAKDFSEGGTNKMAANLSGANFEIVMPNNDTDNPQVPNMIVNGTTHTDLLGYGVGYAPAFLFKQEGNLTDFLNQQAQVVESMFGPKTIFKISTDLIIDGVETGQVDQVKYKSLTNTVDRGFITVTDTGTREVYVRKTTTVEGSKKVYADSDNSTADFEIRVGQRNFPAK